MTNYQKVREFHKVFGAALDRGFDTSEESLKLNETRWNLLREEFEELDNELDFTYYGETSSKAALAKELADLLYVTYGTAAAFGIDIDAVFDKVHENNMSKVQPDGTVKYREDGKVMKPDGYKAINLETLLD